MSRILLRFLLAIIAGQRVIMTHKSVVLGLGMVIVWTAVFWQLCTAVQQAIA
jgi:hypothetical protein